MTELSFSNLKIGDAVKIVGLYFEHSSYFNEEGKVVNIDSDKWAEIKLTNENLAYLATAIVLAQDIELVETGDNNANL